MTVTRGRGELTREAIAAIDTAGQLYDIVGLPEQLRDAMWRAQSAQLVRYLDRLRVEYE